MGLDKNNIAPQSAIEVNVINFYFSKLGKLIRKSLFIKDINTFHI